MTFIGKISIVYCVCLSTYLVLECDTQVLCGYQRCRPGFSYCFNSRCRRCADLDGTSYGCSDDTTWRNCYSHCREKLIQEHENEKHVQNQTWSKRFDELKHDIEVSNHTVNHVIKANDTRFYVTVTGIVGFGLLFVTLIISVFLVHKQFMYLPCIVKKAPRINVDPENPESNSVLSREPPFEVEENDTMTSLVPSEETRARRMEELEFVPQDSLIECTYRQEQDLLRNVPVQDSVDVNEPLSIRLSTIVTSNSPPYDP